MNVRKDLQMNECYLDWTLNRTPKKNKYDELKDISSFEKYMLCNYLLNLMEGIDINEYNFKKFFDDLNFVFKFKTKITVKRPDNLSQREISFTKNKIKKELISYLQDAKIPNSTIKTKMNLIADLYNLNKPEYNFLLYYILKEINPLIQLIGTFSLKQFEDFETFGIYVLKLKKWNVAKIKNQMIKKGIFTKHGFNDAKLALNSKILQIFSDTDIKTKTQIKNILLGKNQKSELKWNDFKHITKERDITKNILTSAIENNTKGVNILLYGSVGTGKTQFAKLIANKAKIDMYSTSAQFMDKEATRKDRLSDLASKQAILSKVGKSCILFDEAEDVMNRGFTEFGSASKAYLNNLIEETPIPIFWTTNNIYNVDPAFLRRMTYTIEFEKLTDDIRLNIWKRVIRKNKFEIDKDKLVELNKNYDIPPALITNAVKTTKLVDGKQDDFEGFVENLAKVVSKKKNVKKKKGFEMQEYNDNLVNSDLDIKDLTAKIKTCGKLNFSLCLYGEPGTGKSLYARYLAKELGLEVIIKRASDLISPYVGETEQNIAEAFSEAKSKKAMLIFDEADTFLQNRNNATRRWEISQVNEMLTWMEVHEYPFICTTNLMNTLDEASLRRFTFKIKFDFLSKEQVNSAFNHFFGIKNPNIYIKGLTAGDFATVKKKADFLGITDLGELSKMLEAEVKIKRSKALQNVVGF